MVSPSILNILLLFSVYMKFKMNNLRVDSIRNSPASTFCNHPKFHLHSFSGSGFYSADPGHIFLLNWTPSG